MTLKLDLRSHASQNIPVKQGGARRPRTLFNPFIPIHLNRAVWFYLDLGAATAFLAHFLLVRQKLTYVAEILMLFLAEQHLVAAKLIRKNGATRAGADPEKF